MSTEETGCGGPNNYFSLIPSLYCFLDDQAREDLEKAIYLGDLGFYAESLSIFENQLSDWMIAPVVVYEKALMYWGQWKVRDAYNLLSTFLEDVESGFDEEELNQPEYRLLAILLGLAEIFHKGQIERAVREVNRTRTWLKEISVDCYTDVQIAVLGLFLNAEKFILFSSNQSQRENVMIPKPNGPPRPWSGLVDMRTYLLASGKFDEAYYLVRCESLRHCSPKSLIRMHRKILRRLPPINPEIVPSKKLSILDIRLRISLADQLCDWDEFDKAQSELRIIEDRLIILCSSLGLDVDSLRDTRLFFAFQLTKYRALPKTALKERYLMNLALLTQSKAACHSGITESYMEAALAAKTLYQKTGDETWSVRTSVLFEEKEAFQFEVLGDICKPLLEHCLSFGRGDIGFQDMSETELERIVEWYERYESQFPYFDIPRIAYDAIAKRVDALASLGDSGRCILAKFQQLTLVPRLPSTSGAEAMNREESDEGDSDQEDNVGEKGMAAYAIMSISLGLTPLMDLFNDAARCTNEDPLGNKMFAGQAQLIQWMRDDIDYGILSLADSKTIFEDHPETQLSGDNTGAPSNMNSPFDLEEIGEMNIAERLFGPHSFPVSDELWARRKAALHAWLRRPSKTPQVRKDFVLVSLCQFRASQLQPLLNGSENQQAYVDSYNEDGYGPDCQRLISSLRDCIAVLDTCHSDLRSFPYFINLKMDWKTKISRILIFFAIFNMKRRCEPGGDHPATTTGGTGEESTTSQLESIDNDEDHDDSESTVNVARRYMAQDLAMEEARIEEILHREETKAFIVEAIETFREATSRYETESIFLSLAMAQVSLAQALLLKIRVEMAEYPEQVPAWAEEGLQMLAHADKHQSIGLRRRGNGSTLESLRRREDFQITGGASMIGQTALNLLQVQGSFEQQDTIQVWEWVQRLKAKALESAMHGEKYELPDRVDLLNDIADEIGRVDDDGPLTLTDLDQMVEMSGTDSITFIDWFSVQRYPTNQAIGRIFMIIAKPGEKPILEDLGMTDGDVLAWNGIKWLSGQSGLQGGRDLENAMCIKGAKSPLRELGKLVEPLSKHTKPGELLVFCPSKLLHQVPLHALELPGVGQDISSICHECSTARDRLVLIHRNPIVYCYSLSVLRRNFQQAFATISNENPAVSREVAIFGDIAVGKGYQKGREMAQELGDWFEAKPFLNKVATKSAFLEKAPNSSLIHFHTHVSSDDPNPLGHAIVLWHDNYAAKTTMPEDIRTNPHTALAWMDQSYSYYRSSLDTESITAGEIINQVDLRSPCHVTLIACSGGRVRVHPADDVMGLIPSFMMKGATSAIGTLWSIPDPFGAEFTRNFYKSFTIDADYTERKGRLTGFVNLARAFQEAVIRMDPSAEEPPMRWAPFVLQGCWMYPAPLATQQFYHPWNIEQV